jgi:hypothetical protein
MTAEEVRPPAPAGGEGVDWRAALTVECGFHAARDLHRRLASVVATPGCALAATDRLPHGLAPDSLALAAVERRWVPSPRS